MLRQANDGAVSFGVRSPSERHLTGIVASLPLIARSPGREDFAVTVEIGTPYQVGGTEWACPVSLWPLYDTLSDQHGEGSFQAMFLAISLALVLLKDFQDKGGTLLYPGEENAPIDEAGFSFDNYKIDFARSVSMTGLMRFATAVPHDPTVDAWFAAPDHELRRVVQPWFELMRKCGPDVRELLADGHPTACVDDAAFGYVDAFSAHANVGFLHGASLDDPAGLLQGAGKRMRHVKLHWGEPVDEAALDALIAAAYRDIQVRLQED